MKALFKYFVCMYFPFHAGNSWEKGNISLFSDMEDKHFFSETNNWKFHSFSLRLVFSITQPNLLTTCNNLMTFNEERIMCNVGSTESI